MKISSSDIRIAGCIWLFISPYLTISILMGSNDESLWANIQNICFFAAGFMGFISGCVLIFQQKWASVILRIISWVYAAYFFGYSVFIIFVSISEINSGKMLAIVTPLFSFIFIVLGGIFIFLANYLKHISLFLSKSKEA